jgi:hypothetical protein
MRYDYVTKQQFEEYYSNSNKNILITRQDLIDYCNGKEITKDVFEDIQMRIPMGADLITELNACGIDSKYIKQLNREKKLKRILK